MHTKIVLAVLTCLVFCCACTAQKTATGALLVLNKADNTMVVVDAATLKIAATVPTGEGPHEVRRVELGPLLRPHGIEAKDGKVYFISELTRTVGRYDFTTNKIDWLTGTGQDGGHMLVLTPDGKRIYTANRVSNTVTSIDIGTPSSSGKMMQIATGSKPEGIDISPDGREVWVGNTGDGTIDIIDAASNAIKQSFAVGKVPIRVKFTSDGKMVLVSDNGAGELIVIDAASRKVIKRIKAESSPVGMLIVPDGKKAFVARSGSGIVSVFDLETLTFTSDIKAGNAPDGMAWVE